MGKKTFGADKITPEVLSYYRRISEDHDIPLRIVATLGATESMHGVDKRIEKKGNTRGIFHVTRLAAIDSAEKVLKEKSLGKKMRSMSNTSFREWVAENPEQDARLAGGYMKMAYDKAGGDPVRTYGYYNAGVYNKKFNKLQLENQRRFSERYEDSGKYMDRFKVEKFNYEEAAKTMAMPYQGIDKDIMDTESMDNFVIDPDIQPTIDSIEKDVGRSPLSTDTPIKPKLTWEQTIGALSKVDPTADYAKENVHAVLDNKPENFIPQITSDTPMLAAKDTSAILDKQEPVMEETVQAEPVVNEEPVRQAPKWNVKPGEFETMYDNLQNLSFEGMGNDLVNKFIDSNAVGFIGQNMIQAIETKDTFDPNFDPYKDKEMFSQMTEGLDNEEIEDVLKNSNNHHDFITNASLAQGRIKRKEEVMKYAQEHPVLSGVNSVANVLAEGAAFLPVGSLVSSATNSTKIRSLGQLANRSKISRALTAEILEQGLQEVIWSANDKDYEFDPLIFAGSLAAGVGLRRFVTTAENDKILRDLISNEKGFINISTEEGKKLVDEVERKLGKGQAFDFAEKLAKKKVKTANSLRRNLEVRRRSMIDQLHKHENILNNKKSVSQEVYKKTKGKKQKLVRRLHKFDNELPNQLKQLAQGTHPKLTASVNPEFSLKKIAQEVGVPLDQVKTPELARKFLGLDGPDINPDFIFEGEKEYHGIMRDQLREMSDNKRLNANEVIKSIAGSGTVKSIDELPIIGKMQLGDKLRSLAETDGPVTRLLFNKGNLVSSNNEAVSTLYNWLAPDGMGRQGMSKMRAIESQQKYSNIYGGDLMNIYHSHGDKLFEAMEGKGIKSKAKGFISPDLYEDTVEPLFKERLLSESAEAFRKKYGDEIADIADDFYSDFNKLNAKITERAKELGVEGVNFEATDGWFHRSWDFRKARSVDTEELQDGIFRAMKGHMEKLGLEIDEAAITKHAKKFAYGIKNADISVIDGMQSDHIKLLDKLANKATEGEAKTIRNEIARLKALKAKHDAGDLANRVQMDVTVKLADGRQLSDLFEDNVIHTQRRYTARMAARIAAAEHGIKNIDQLDDWVADAVELEVKRLADKGVKNPRQAAKHVEEAMRQDVQSFKTGGMTGLHDLPDDAANDFVRLVKKYNYARLMQYTGISSIAEFGGTLVEAGVDTTLNQVGKTIRNHLMNLFEDNPEKYTDRLYDELRSITGVGMEDFSFSSKGMSKASRISESGLANSFEKGIDSLGRVTQGTFGGIEKTGRRITANSLAIKWGNHFMEREKGGLISAFFGSNGFSNRVLENSGFGKVTEAGEFIPNKTYNKIKSSFKKHVTFDDSGNIVKLNLDKWNTETAQSFGDAIQMQSNHIMVNPDATTMALWQSSTVGQIINQFRTFTVNATTKVAGQTFANAAISANRGDQSEMIKAGQKIFWGTSLGVLSVAVRQGIQRAGGDKEVDLFDEGLIKAAAIGFSRSSVAGNLPTIADTISGAFGFDPIFEKTSSIGRSKNIFNLATSPTGQAVGGVYQGVEKGLQGDFKGSGMQLLKVSPIYRQIGAQQLFNFIEKEK